jgi:hypothetical protein
MPRLNNSRLLCIAGEDIPLSENVPAEKQISTSNKTPDNPGNRKLSLLREAHYSNWHKRSAVGHNGSQTPAIDSREPEQTPQDRHDNSRRGLRYVSKHHEDYLHQCLLACKQRIDGISYRNVKLQYSDDD